MNTSIRKELLSRFSGDIGTSRVRFFYVTSNGDVEEGKGFYHDDMIRITPDSAGGTNFSKEVCEFIKDLDSVGYGLDLYNGKTFKIHPNEVKVMRWGD